MQSELLKSKKGKVAGGMDIGLIGLIVADKLDPVVGAICITVVTVAYLIAQCLADSREK